MRTAELHHPGAAARERGLHVAHVLPWQTVGGVEVGALRLAQGLAERGIRNTALCAGAGRSDVGELFRAHGFDVHGYQPFEPSYRRAREWWRHTRALSRQLRGLAPDVVHGADLLAGYHVALGARFAGVPAVCHVRCAYPEISRRDQSFLWPIREFLFVSEDTRRAFSYRAGARRGTVVLDGYDPPPPAAAAAAARVRSQWGIPADAFLVGMVSRVAPIKDYDTLIAAAAHAVERVPGMHFMVVGDNREVPANRAYYEALQPRLAAAGLAGRFRFTGRQAELGAFYAAFDAVTLVTHSEGLPLALLEAMSAGRPVVATAVGGIPELVTDGVNGLLHAHGDAAGLADALVAVATDRVLAARLAAGGRGAAASFSLDALVGRVAAVYAALPRSTAN